MEKSRNNSCLGLESRGSGRPGQARSAKIECKNGQVERESARGNAKQELAQHERQTFASPIATKHVNLRHIWATWLLGGVCV